MAEAAINEQEFTALCRVAERLENHRFLHMIRATVSVTQAAAQATSSKARKGSSGFIGHPYKQKHRPSLHNTNNTRHHRRDTPHAQGIPANRGQDRSRRQPHLPHPPPVSRFP
jgi:hypothetical protein